MPKRNQPARIAFIVPSLSIGGTELTVAQLVPRLNRARFDPLVVALTSGLADDCCALLAQHGIELVSLRARGMWDLSAVPKLAAVLRRRRIEIAQSCLFWANVVSPIAARLAGVPVVITGERDLGFYRQGCRKLVHRITASLANHVVANSEAVKATLVEQGLRASKISVVLNGLDPARVVPRRQRQLVRAELGIEDHHQLVGTILRLTPIKGVHHLIEAIPSVLRVIPNARFVIVGDVPQRKHEAYRARLMERIRQLGITSQVGFTGHRPDVGDLLNAFDLFVLPSLSEGMPNGLLEAMAAGLPCVATRVGGVPEALEHGCEGLLVAPGDHVALADALLAYLRDPVTAGAHVAAARRKIGNQFRWERAAAELELLYLSLLDFARATGAAQSAVAPLRALTQETTS